MGHSHGHDKGCCSSCDVKKSQGDKLPGGAADGMDPSDFDAKKLKAKTDEEMEHTNDRGVAREIAMDHLAEKSLDPAQYFDIFKAERTDDPQLTWKPISKSKIVRKIDFQGLDISIETDKGQYRYWYDPHGQEKGKTKMAYPYGYICRTMGADDEQIDVYVGPDDKSDQVFIIHQMKKPSFEKFDEDKVMIGFSSPREAKAAYLMHYNDDRFFGSMTETTIESFKKKFVDNATSKSDREKVDRLWDKLEERKPGSKAKYGMDKAFGQQPQQMDPMAAQQQMAPQMMGMMNPMGMMGMGMMGPPPTDVETFDGVMALLGRIGSVKDQELMDISCKIWGEGYDFQGKSPDQARSEIIGFLLDQRDLLGAPPILPALQQSPSSPGMSQGGSGNYSQPSMNGAAPQGVPSQQLSSPPAATSPQDSYQSWFEQDFSRQRSTPAG